MTRFKYANLIKESKTTASLIDTDIELMSNLFDVDNNKYTKRILDAKTVGTMYEIITDMATYANKDVTEMCVLTKNYMMYLADENIFYYHNSRAFDMKDILCTYVYTLKQISLIDSVMAAEYSLLQ